MDILVIVQKKGFSGLRELTENILSNLNFRAWSVTDFTSHSMFGFSGSSETTIASAVPNTEIEAYLQLLFGISPEQSRNIFENLVTLGFLRRSYVATKWSPRWVDESPWNCLVSSNLTPR